VVWLIIHGQRGRFSQYHHCSVTAIPAHSSPLATNCINLRTCLRTPFSSPLVCPDPWTHSQVLSLFQWVISLCPFLRVEFQSPFQWWKFQSPFQFWFHWEKLPGSAPVWAPVPESTAVSAPSPESTPVSPKSLLQHSLQPQKVFSQFSHYIFIFNDRRAFEVMTFVGITAEQS